MKEDRRRFIIVLMNFAFGLVFGILLTIFIPSTLYSEPTIVYGLIGSFVSIGLIVLITYSDYLYVTNIERFDRFMFKKRKKND